MIAVYVWPRYRFAFLAMPATGSVAVARALMHAGGRCLNGHHDTPAEHVERLHAMGYDHTWRTATTVRDPHDWFRSMFRKGAVGAHEHGPINVEWIQRLEQDRRWFQPCGRDLFWKYVPYATDVWRQETLQADLDRTLVEIGAPALTLERWNVSQWEDASFTAEAFAYILDRYRWLSRYSTSATTTS